MISNGTGFLARSGVLVIPLLLTGCERAPSISIMGSFFPGWLACFIVGILLTALFRSMLQRARIALAFPVLIYPSLTALICFVLWLIFFR
jgi:protein AaeX